MRQLLWTLCDGAMGMRQLILQRVSPFMWVGSWLGQMVAMGDCQ